MDFISLYLTFLLMRRSFKALNGILASAVGAFFAVVMTYFDITGLIGSFLGLSVSFIMILICVGGRLKVINYIKYTVYLWGIGALLAGGVTFVCSLGGENTLPSVKSHGAAPLLVLFLGVVLTEFFLKTIISVPKIRECTVDVCCFGVKVTASAMVDTGNLVVEPMSGLPVVFIKKSLFLPFEAHLSDIELLSGDISGIDRLSPDIRRRARVVSVKRVGETKLLIGTVTSELFVKVKGQKGRKPYRAVVVIEDVEDYGGFDCIVPQSAVI